MLGAGAFDAPGIARLLMSLISKALLNLLGAAELYLLLLLGLLLIRLLLIRLLLRPSQRCMMFAVVFNLTVETGNQLNQWCRYGDKGCGQVERRHSCACTL